MKLDVTEEEFYILLKSLQFYWGCYDHRGCDRNKALEKKIEELEEKIREQRRCQQS
jgi:hypothetical protein